MDADLHEEMDDDEPLARRVLHEEPRFDKNEGLTAEDLVDAESFPASDPPPYRK